MIKFNTENWERKKQYDFFKSFQDPSFGISADVDVTPLFHFVKKNDLSFFLSSLYCSTKAANSIENFLLRIKGEEVFKVDKNHVGSTILKRDKNFTYCVMEMKDDIREFCEHAQKEIDFHLREDIFDSKAEMLDLIYYSVIPWVSFSSIKHPKNNDQDFSIPRIVFGKYKEIDKRIYMPVSVEVNHALMDGYHVGLYFERFQELIDGL